MARTAIASEVTPAECSKMEELLRYRRICTPNVLTTPWDMRTAAYMPIVFPAVGVYEDLTVAVVDISPARPNEIPVVTATWPRRLNLFIMLACAC